MVILLSLSFAHASTACGDYTLSTTSEDVEATLLMDVCGGGVDRSETFFGAMSTVGFESLTEISEDYIRDYGVVDFYDASSGELEDARAAITTAHEEKTEPTAFGGRGLVRAVQMMPWGMIEIEPGTLKWGLMDMIVAGVQTRGGNIVGTLQPYADWDLMGTSSAPGCFNYYEEDYYYLYYDARMDFAQNRGAWSNFVSAVVERYDYDGSLGEPATLRKAVEVWEVHNEPDNWVCGMYCADAPRYVSLLKHTSNAIKAADPAALVMNGGSGQDLFPTSKPVCPSFWPSVGALGGGAYLDILNIHYNNGKSKWDHGDEEDFEVAIDAMQGYFPAGKPLWVTEYGVFIGDDGTGEDIAIEDGDSPNFYELEEAEAAAWYVRFTTAGLYAGAERFFPDSMSFSSVSGELLLPFFTNVLIWDQLGGFSNATKINKGQYHFTVDTEDVWVLWDGVPAALDGVDVQTTDIYGQTDCITVDAASLEWDEDNPLFAVRASCSLGLPPHAPEFGQFSAL